MRLDDAAVVTAPNGRSLTVDARDVPVPDDTPAGRTATVSFRITWRAHGARRRLGRAPRVGPTDPAAFSGLFFTGARATGTFSGSVGAFSFQTDPAKQARSSFAEVGTEQNGAYLPAAARCRACAGDLDAAGNDAPAGW